MPGPKNAGETWKRADIHIRSELRSVPWTIIVPKMNTTAKAVLPSGVYERLSADIVEGRISPGSSLREEQIAELMGVSRTPVREALRRLSDEGFVEYFPHRGARLMRLTADRVHEVFEVREALEGMAARHAATRMPAERIAALRTEFQRIGQQIAEADFRDVGDGLHIEIFNSCGNDRLKRLMLSIRNQVTWMQRIAVTLPGRLGRAFHEHNQVLKALENRDPDGAERAMRTHIQATLRELLTGVSNGE